MGKTSLTVVHQQLYVEIRIKIIGPLNKETMYLLDILAIDFQYL